MVISMTLCIQVPHALGAAVGNQARLSDIIHYFNGKIQINNLQFSLMDHAPSMVFKDQKAYEAFKENFKLEDHLQVQKNICCLSYDSEHGNYCYKEIAKEDYQNNQLHARSGLFLGKSGSTWWNGQPRGFTVLQNSRSGNTVENGITNTFFSGVRLDATLFVHLGLEDYHRGTFQAEQMDETRSTWTANTESGVIYGLLESNGNSWSLIKTNEQDELTKKVLFEWDVTKSLPNSVTVVDPETDKVFQHYVTFEGKDWWNDFEPSFSYGYHTNTTDAILFIDPDGASEIKHGGKLVDDSSRKGSIRSLIIMICVAFSFIALLNIKKIERNKIS